MKKLAALLIAVVLCSAAHASPLLLMGSAPSPASCPVGAPPPAGSTITPNTGCSVTDAAVRKWMFETTPYQYMNPVGCCYALDVNGQFSGVTAASKFSYCPSPSTNFPGLTPSGDYFTTNAGRDPATNGAVLSDLWWQFNPGPNSAFQVASCGGAYLTVARNETTGTDYPSLAQALNSVHSPNTVVTLNAPPPGVPAWIDGAVIGAHNPLPPTATGDTSDGLTVNGSGNPTLALFNNEYFQGIISVLSDNVTLNGLSLEYADAGGGAAVIKIDDGAKNPTLTNIVAQHADTPITSGGENGLVKLAHVLINDGGHSDNPGNDHNIYLSAHGCGVGGVQSGGTCTKTGTPDPTSYDIEDLVSLNVAGDGWGAKLRPGSGTASYTTHCPEDPTAGCLDYSIIGSTTNSWMHAILDIPCGGNVIAKRLVLEAPPATDTPFAKIRFGEESAAVSAAPANCPSYGWYPKYSLVYDRNILIDDTANAGGASVNTAICLAAQSGGACNVNPGAGWVCTVTNSVFVNHTGGPLPPMVVGAGCTGIGGAPIGCTMASGKCTDPSNNRFYQDRLTAAQNEGWIGSSFTDPISGVVYQCSLANGCAFPYLPQRMS